MFDAENNLLWRAIGGEPLLQQIGLAGPVRNVKASYVRDESRMRDKLIIMAGILPEDENEAQYCERDAAQFFWIFTVPATDGPAYLFHVTLRVNVGLVLKRRTSDTTYVKFHY